RGVRRNEMAAQAEMLGVLLALGGHVVVADEPRNHEPDLVRGSAGLEEEVPLRQVQRFHVGQQKVFLGRRQGMDGLEHGQQRPESVAQVASLNPGRMAARISRVMAYSGGMPSAGARGEE